MMLMHHCELEGLRMERGCRPDLKSSFRQSSFIDNGHEHHLGISASRSQLRHASGDTLMICPSNKYWYE